MCHSPSLPRGPCIFIATRADMNTLLEIRSARLGDAASACAVLRRSIAECCTEDHRNDDAVLAAWLGNKTPETVAAWFLSPANFSVVAVTADVVIGVAILARSGKIALCYVTPEARFTGAGKAMLHALEERARQWGLSALSVASTATAADFYRRNGYLEGGVTTSAFGVPALAFSKRLCNSYKKKAANCRCAA